MAAATAEAYKTRAVASLKRDSPSMMAESRRGRPSRPAGLVMAAGSVGPTAVPRAAAIAQERWPTSWSTGDTTAAARTTRPMARYPIGSASREKAYGDDEKAAW